MTLRQFPRIFFLGFIFWGSMGCNEHSEAVPLEGLVTPECRLVVLLDWQEEISSEVKMESYSLLGDELVEATLLAEQFQIAIDFDVQDFSKFVLHFSNNCEVKDDYATELFSFLLRSHEGISGFSIREVNPAENS